jgi:hypothetical protein
MSKRKYTYDQALIAELMQVLRPVNVRRVRIVAQTLHEMEREEDERLAARKEVMKNEEEESREEAADPTDADS